MAKSKNIDGAEGKTSASLPQDEDLASIISKNISKQFKDVNDVIFYLNEDDSPSDVKEWVSTGSSLLDLAISNRPNGGIPVGRITEITGLNSSGKSLVSAHILAETQKMGGIAMFIDTESAVSTDFLAAIGVDRSKNWMYLRRETIEDIFSVIESAITTTRNNDKSKYKLLTIVVDSLAGASTKVEMDADYTKDGWATAKAILLSKAMRKITNLIATEKICLVFTNQLRTKMNAMAFADPYTTSGGMAVAFHSSVRIRLSNAGALKKKDWGGVDQIIGNKIDAKIIKNRIGPPQRKASFEIFYDSGIDNYSGWIKVLTTYKFLKQGGAYYTYTLDGEDIKFQSKELPLLLQQNKKLYDSMYKNLCDASITSYKKNGIICMDDDVELDTNDQGGAE